MTQYLYLIKCQQYFKIGVANDVQSRLAQLSTGNPFELEPLTVCGFNNASAVEAVLHQRFASKRTRGEWFILDPEDITLFDKIIYLLGGTAPPEISEVNDAEIEDAEEIQDVFDYQPTIEDVKRLMSDPNYRLEYRYGDNGLRGFAWRLRTGNKECPLYIGKRSPIFEEVRRLLPEHHPNGNGQTNYIERT